MNVNDVKKVAVFGAGTMGPGLALVFALGGYEVSLYSRKAETLDKAMAMVQDESGDAGEPRDHRGDGGRRGAGAHPPHPVSGRGGRDADFVMETIAENKDAKTALYAELDTICPERTVFASNTSSLNIFELMPASRLVADGLRALLRPGSHHPPGRGGSRVRRPHRRHSHSPLSSSRRSARLPWS